MINVNINDFISRSVTRRSVSLFKEDLSINRSSLKNKINDKSVLVIGGAGTIGSSYIKALLKFKPSKFLMHSLP